MKLPYERLAYFSLGAMLTTLLVTHAPQHQTRPLADAFPLSGDRCAPPSLTEEAATIVRNVLDMS